MKKLLIPAFVIAVASLALLSGPASADHYETVQLEGLAYEYPELASDVDPSDVRDSIEASPLDVKSNVMGFTHTTGASYIVMTDRDITVAEANITAYQIPTPSLPTQGILYELEGQSTYATDATEVRHEILSASTLAYNGDLVSLQGEQLTGASWEIESDAGLTNHQSAIGVGTTHSSNASLARQFRSRFLRVTESAESGDVEFGSPLPDNTATISYGPNSQMWWFEGQGDLTTGILNNGENADIGLTRSYALDAVKVNDDPDALQGHVGDVVRFQSNIVGAKMSTRDVLVQASSCPPDMVGASGACAPAVVDATVHTGVLGPGEGEAVPYFGVNNERISQTVMPYGGSYSITARVVDASTLDPRLDSQIALQVYEMESAGGSAETSRLRSEASAIRETIHDQLTMEQSEWDSAVKTQSRNAEIQSTENQPQEQQTTSLTESRSGQDEETQSESGIPTPLEGTNWIFLFIGMAGALFSISSVTVMVYSLRNRGPDGSPNRVFWASPVLLIVGLVLLAVYLFSPL